MFIWDIFWTDICPTGLRPWVQSNSDLAPCFQELVLQLPILALFATFSSYFYGTHWRTVSRNDTQLRALRVRIFASLGLTIIPALKVLYIFRLHEELYPVDILLACVQLVAWPIHCCFLLSSMRKGSLSHRGPLVLIVLWTSLFALCAIWLHTNLHTEYWPWYAAHLAVYLCYGATLVSPGHAHYVRLRRTDHEERQALLSQSYTRFFEDLEETALGPIEDDANMLSKIVFYWVRPLIAKGVSGKLKRSDDLFDLPEALTLHRVTEKLQLALSTTTSLLKALHKCFGWEFYMIGLLRLLGDLSGFAGPILLGGLLRTEDIGNGTTLTDPADPNRPIDFRAYYYALALLTSAVISAFAAVHFNWRMTFVSSKMRMSIVTAIYQKSLSAKQLQTARPEILNLMSTDTDRIVNSCISFHSFWSIPFQLFTTLYLLYTQLGVAFMAGVLFAVLLIPINRKIAQKIGQLSQGLMSAKDGRVTITTETISGAKDIKLNAWEDVFIGKIQSKRKEEMRFLGKRKYLDALCVYFWATTPVLMCLFTFGTSILLGKPLTAATTYTSVALLNMLIGPLNAFPWVLNGLTEAWVSLKRVQELLDLPDVNLQEYYRPLSASDASYSNSSKRPVVLAIKDGSFEFETKRSRNDLKLVQEDIIDFAFRDLTLQVRQGELVCLEGPVATQILHVEAGQVSQSDAPNVGSLLSEYDDYDEDTSATLSIANDSTPYATVVRNEDDQRSNDSVLMEESREFGHLDRTVLGAYWQATGRSLGFWVVVAVLMMQISRNLTDAWLAYWVGTINQAPQNGTAFVDNPTVLEQKASEGVLAMVDHLLAPAFTDGSNGTSPSFYYLGIYATLAITNSLLTLLRAFLFAYAGLKAAKCIHDRLLNSVLYTKLQFFDVVPLGRILNRFSSDVYTVDDTLPFIMNILLAQFFGLLGALLISLYAMPWLGLLIVPLVPIYLSLQNKYRYASRDIKRLSSNALSPLYAHFTETLQGLTTIRALRGEKRFQRDFLYKLGESIKAQLSAAATQQWLGLRLQLLGAFLVGGSGLLAAITSAHTTSPELVGLAISYALSITGLLSGLLYAVAETEQELVAVERINQYCQLEPEVNADGSADPPFGWPSQGVVVFDNVHMRYREHLTYSIRSINMNVKPCERISIVGRTGSGKTSVMASLLRVAPLDKGTITVDFVNISTLPLDVLRSRIALISQDPFLFNGTIRDNLDPRAVHIDSEIWEAITCCLASPLVQALGGLYAQLDVSGANLSAGQKQLLCLTRALLKKSKIVLIDEGTSNLDFESESAVQLVLKNAFRGRTVIVVAHRLRGILDTDQVFVMQDGNIVEQGAPRDLADQPNSLLYSLLQEQQNS
uniref:ABC-type xenobiotic transporter n=1 Tax=Anopheles stephensi TaxID=30069 RepID=A0A182YGV8_ANOST